MMTIDSLLRGQAYHFTFTDRELDAILIDVDYALTNADKLRLFSLDENQNISAESIAVPAADYIDAAPIYRDNSSAIQSEIDRVMAEIGNALPRAEGDLLCEDDAVDGIEQREDEACVSFYSQKFTEMDCKTALFYILNSMPYLLKRKPQNRLAYRILLFGIVKGASCEDEDIVRMPVFPDQSDLYAAANVTMLRKMAYQAMHCHNNASLGRLEGAARFTGYIHNYQGFNSRGLILFANERNMLPFSNSGIMDRRLADLLQYGLSEVGRIEVEFSLGYIPKEGGAQVSNFTCTRITLTDMAVKCCRALEKDIPDETSRYEGYRENPICPASYYPADSYLGISRMFREGKMAKADSGEKSGLRNPLGTQTGYIVQWPLTPKKNGNGSEVWEGELACNGNVIHFNLYQVYEESLRQLLTTSPEQAIGIKVKFEPAFSASKNRIAIWADVVRTAECDMEIPPEYDPQTPWSVEKSQREWTPPAGAAENYRVLQPWLPMFNPLLENCHVGKLDLMHLSASQSFLGGRINSPAAQGTIWYNFQMSSIHERYLESILMSALCYEVCKSAADPRLEISVVFNLQPSSIPGRDMADNIILMPISRGTIWNMCGRKLACPVNRSGNVIFEMAENYLPLQLKGKPLQFQKDYISRYATPDIFSRDAEYSGQITKLYENGVGLIVDSQAGAEIPFKSEQIYEAGLPERIRQSFATNRYTGVLVKFQKRQAQQDKSIAAVRADRIYSRELEKENVTPRPEYRPLCGAASQAEKKPVVSRKGILVDYRRTAEGIICSLCDENPTVWLNENDEQIVRSHFSFGVERISDGRLRCAIEAGTLNRQIPVAFELVKADQADAVGGSLIRPDNVRITDETAAEYGLTESKDYSFTHSGRLLSGDEIQNAKYYEGKVTANVTDTKIWIEIEAHDEKPCYLVGGKIRELGRINANCTSSDKRQYVLESTLREKLQNRELGMKVRFIPIKPVSDDYAYPQAGYMTFAPDERARLNISGCHYYPSFVPQVYMPGSPVNRASTASPLAEGAGAAPENAGAATAFDFDALLYSRARNDYDRLIRGEIDSINGNYREAAAYFRAGEASKGHTVMSQEGETEDGRLEGLRCVASREKRIAYADALIRNRDLVFEKPENLLNTIADLLCTRKEIINWESNFDSSAYRIMQQYKRAMVQFRLHEQMIQRVEKIIAQMEIARGAGGQGNNAATVAGNYRLAPGRVVTPAAPSATAPFESFPIVQKVPLLKYVIRQTAANGRPQRQGDVLRTIMSKAEALLKSAKDYGARTISNRLCAAAYYYGIVLRDQWTDCPEGSPEFARRAMAFMLLPYDRFEALRRTVQARAMLWETLVLPDDITMLPQKNMQDAAMLRYLHCLMQTACFSSRAAEFFTPDESEMLLNREKADNPWPRILERLCDEMKIPHTETTDIRAILSAYRARLSDFESALPRIGDTARSAQEHINDFRRLGDRNTANTPIYNCVRASAGFQWPRDTRVTNHNGILEAYLNSLERLAAGANSDKTSVQINSFAEMLRDLRSIKNYIIQEPTVLTAELILPCVDSYIDCLEAILKQLCLSRDSPELKAQTGSINETEMVFTVPISISCRPESSGYSGIHMSARKREINNILQPLDSNRAIYSLDSGDTVIVEMRFAIQENIAKFRERQSISIVLRLDYDAVRFSSGRLDKYATDSEANLDCPIQQAQYEIDPNAFNSKATQYDESRYFAGRETQINRMKNALYDSEEKLFRYGVGVIIFGQRRSGKSWLAGKLCAELKKEEAAQKPIICDKIDISQLNASSDIMTEIINKIVAAIPQSDRDLAQAALEYAKPFSMLDIVERTLQLQRLKNDELDFDEILSHLEAVRDGIRKLNGADHASFSTFYHELERKYTERHGMPLPAITIVLDEFTNIYDQIMSRNMTLQEALSVVKLIESYRINVILICADHYRSVLTAIDENAFTHYKTLVEVTGLDQQEAVRMICRPLAAKRIGGSTNEQEDVRPRIDEDGAIHLHLLYNGNVYLLAKACDSVINHMNYHGYLQMSGRQLDSFENELLVSTMNRESMNAYIVDGRFLERKIASYVLTRLNIIAISTVAHTGTQGIALYSDVLNAVKAEYHKLFMPEDMRHFVDLLNENGQEGKISDRDMVIEREYAMERISAENVLDWLVERKVLYKGGSTSGEVTLMLKLQAYIRACDIPNCECYHMEEMSTHAESSAENPTLNLTDEDLEIFGDEYGDE